MSVHQEFEHDVIVIGAGGAGLRAAIEAAAAGVKVGLICKSLLGKAHTVMAEGGMAASLANVDERDGWTVHFADTMRGGQYLNNWRMAELHAKESPDRARELEKWGALFDRTPDGKIIQRNFGGHAYPRLAHVGDRTGLEMIRTLQDHGIHQGIDVHMEVTVTKLLKDGDRCVGAFAYDREQGRFRVFKAKAVVLATGGLGRAFLVTSNSWEGTGDGHSLGYDAGAELVDMEFIQFHPTGMVWPPSVRGILVTEGVRGEGGILKNSEGKRFMFDDIPPLYVDQTADTPEEGWRYVTGDREARRPPELLTRDHVARKIVKEVKEGRGSPHGGAFLDIAWIKEHIKDSEGHIKKKLPSMYHQFKELAGIDITKEPMEVGPTTHYAMGGIAVDADTQMTTTVPGLFAAGECGGGLHGANRLGGNSLSDLVVFGRRAGEYAAKFAKDNPSYSVPEEQVEAAARDALAPLEREVSGVGPFKIQYELQALMQDKAGIAREEDGLSEALTRIKELKARADSMGSGGNRWYNPGWHTALDLKHLFVVSEAIAMAARERKESRGAHSRLDHLEKDPAWSTFNHIVRKGPDGEMEIHRRDIPEMRQELKDIIEEQGWMATATFKVWRGDKEGGDFQTYEVELEPGYVVLDAIHKIQAEQQNDLACRWNCKAGKCGSCSAEVNGSPRLMCMTRVEDLPEDAPITVEPMRAFPVLKDLVTDVSWNYEVKASIQPITPRAPDFEDGTWAMQQYDVERPQEFRKCIECFLCQDVCHVLRDHHLHDRFAGPRHFVFAAQAEMNPIDTGDRVAALRDELGIGYCNITKCCTKVCPEGITITDNAIIPLKERVVDRSYDPIAKLIGLVKGTGGD